MSGTSPVHRDHLGYLWSTDKLDELLADPAVNLAASAIVAVGLQPCGDFATTRAYDVAQLRYRRKAPAALLTLLATRLWYLRPEGGVDASL